MTTPKQTPIRSSSPDTNVPWSIWWQTAIIVLGAFTSMLSSTIVGTALPILSTALHSSFAGVQWIATGYLLALAAGVPLSAWAARRFGVTRLWLGSLALCCCCPIWCAESKTLHTLMFGEFCKVCPADSLCRLGKQFRESLPGQDV